METPPLVSLIERRPSRFPLRWVLVINCLEFLLTIQFYWIPRGTPIRPMAWAYYVFMLAVAALVAIPLILPTLCKQPRLIWPWVVVVLAFTPYPLADGMFICAQKVCGFILEP
jgi:hypothetical protein